MRVLVLLVAVAVLVGCVVDVMPTVSPLPTPPASPLAVPGRDLEIAATGEFLGGVEMDLAEMLAIAIFLSMVANRLIDALAVPIFERYALDTFWLKYVSWVVGGALVGLSGVNLFVAYLPNEVVGLVLTAIVCGGGANFINDLFGGK